MRIIDWFRALNGGILPNVQVSPFGIYDILTEINRERKGRAKQRVGTSGKNGPYSTLDIMKKTSGEIVWDMDSSIYLEETKRIQSEIPDPTF